MENLNRNRETLLETIVENRCALPTFTNRDAYCHVCGRLIPAFSSKYLVPTPSATNVSVCTDCGHVHSYHEKKPDCITILPIAPNDNHALYGIEYEVNNIRGYNDNMLDELNSYFNSMGFWVEYDGSVLLEAHDKVRDNFSGLKDRLDAVQQLTAFNVGLNGSNCGTHLNISFPHHIPMTRENVSKIKQVLMALQKKLCEMTEAQMINLFGSNFRHYADYDEYGEFVKGGSCSYPFVNINKINSGCIEWRILKYVDTKSYYYSACLCRQITEYLTMPKYSSDGANYYKPSMWGKRADTDVAIKDIMELIKRFLNRNTAYHKRGDKAEITRDIQRYTAE